MSIKSGLTYLGITAIGIAGFEYAIYQAFKERQDLLLGAGAVGGLVGVLLGVKAAIKEFKTPPLQIPQVPARAPNAPQNPNLPAYPQIARTEEDELEEIYHPNTGRVIGRRQRRYRQNP